jgi:hypothetical protein
MISYRVFLKVCADDGREFVVQTNVYARTAHDAETHAIATAAIEGWSVLRTRTQLLPL